MRGRARASLPPCDRAPAVAPSYFFDQASGKKLRPALVLLGAMATREDARQAGTALSAAEEQVAWEGQCRLAEITCVG